MINLMQGFNIGSAVAVDSRFIKSKAEMKTVNDNVMPDKYMTICTDDGLLYLYDKTAVPNDLTGKFRKAVPEKLSELENDGDQGSSFATKAYVDAADAALGLRIDTEIDDRKASIANEVNNLETRDAERDTVKVDFEYDDTKIIFVFRNEAGQELYRTSFELVAGDNIEIARNNNKFTIAATYTGDAETGVSIENGQISVNTFADKVVYDRSSKTILKDVVDDVDARLTTHLDKSGFKHGVGEIEEESVGKQFITQSQRDNLGAAFDHQEKDLLIQKIELVDPDKNRYPLQGGAANEHYAIEDGRTSFEIVTNENGEKVLRLDISNKVSKDGSKVLSTHDFNDTYRDLLVEGTPHLVYDSESGTWKLPTYYLPDSTTSIWVSHASYDDFPVQNTETSQLNGNTIYVARDTSDIYRWSGADPSSEEITSLGSDAEKRAALYIKVSPTISLGETSNTAFPGDRGKKIEDFIDVKTESSGLVKYVTGLTNNIKQSIGQVPENTNVIDYVNGVKSDLSAKITETSGNLTALSNKVGSLPVDYGKTLVEYVDEHDSALNKTISDNKTAIEGGLADLTNTVSANKTELTGKISDLGDKVGDLPSGLPEDVTTVTGYVEHVNTSLNQALATNSTNDQKYTDDKIGDLQGKTVKAYVDDKADQLAESLKGDVSSVQSSLTKNINDLKNTVGGLPEGQPTVVSYIGAVDAKANVNTSNISALSNKVGVDNLPVEQSTVVGYVNSLAGVVSEHKAAADASFSDLTTKVNTNTSNVNTISSKQAPGFRNGFAKLRHSGWGSVTEGEGESSTVLYYSQSVTVHPAYREDTGVISGAGYVFNASACPFLDVSIPLASVSSSDEILLDWSLIFRADAVDPISGNPAGVITFYAKSIPSNDLVVKVTNI